jgi:hypothetical protein
MRWGGNVAHKEEMRKAFGKPTHRWESNVEMDLKEVG